MFPLYPEENDCFPLLPLYLRDREENWTGKLQKFHSQFNGTVRALLRECLFRDVEQQGMVTFQILCPNQAVQKRLIQKRCRIGSMLELIWMDCHHRVAFCIDDKHGFRYQVFSIKGYLLEIKNA
jgi:hypothetical protein